MFHSYDNKDLQAYCYGLEKVPKLGLVKSFNEEKIDDLKSVYKDLVVTVPNKKQNIKLSTFVYDFELPIDELVSIIEGNKGLLGYIALHTKNAISS